MLQNNSYLSDTFHPIVQQWFAATYEKPTTIQNEAWKAISQGNNTLVVAPTGSGKTLAAFLWALQDLLQTKTEDLAHEDRSAKKSKQGVKVLYISPLKALGADVEKNLKVPLAAIESLWRKTQDENSPNRDTPLLSIAMRTGDTTPDERRKIVAHPPDILITTPESLYLMLTSQASSVLKTVQTVIVDEIHSLAPNKRGAHLSLSLERLDSLLERPAQRIGLSATVNPVSVVAKYLGGTHSVTIVKDTQKHDFDLRISVPVTDMAAVPKNGGFVGMRGTSQKGSRSTRALKDAWKTDRTLKAAMAGVEAKPSLGHVTPDERSGSSSLWPYIESSLLDEIMEHTSTIVFVNSRGLCERLTARLNELYAKRLGLAPLLPSDGEGSKGTNADTPSAVMRSDIGGTSQLATPPVQSNVIAKAHHGSVSKEKRLQVEAELKRGELRCVVATSSLELGIDMGSVDLVLQVAPPLSVSSGLQRIGRANHQVDGRSKAIIYPRTRLELLDSAVMAEAMLEGHLESITLVENALDVLAQQTVAAVSQVSYSASDWYDIVSKSACYEGLPKKAYREVLAMVSGYYSRGDLSDFAPRIDWNRETDMLTARVNSQRLAVSGGGTIPDRGLYPVVLPEGVGKAGRKRVGELDEEMVYESRVGDVIALGTSSWRIKEITADRVMVEPAPGRIARLPFWHGEQPGRSYELGQEKGAFVRACSSTLIESEQVDQTSCGFEASMTRKLANLGLDERGMKNLAVLLRAQKAATTWIPTDQVLVVERCQDEMGQWRIFLHSPFGKSVHEPWALAVSWRIQTQCGYDPCALASDDGIMLQIPLTETTLPHKAIFEFDPEDLAHIVQTQVDGTALFAARFRECAMRSLLMSPTPHGKRAPLWQQRIKAGQLLEGARREEHFPLLTEAARECLADVYNLSALQQIQAALASGVITLHDVTTTIPSPFAASLVFAYVGEHLYDPDKPKSAQQTALLSLDTSLLVELLGGANLADLIDEAVLEELSVELQHVDGVRSKKGPEGIEVLLRELGPLTSDEISLRMAACDRADVEKWLADLEHDEKIFSVLLGATAYWAQPQDIPWLRALTSANLPTWVGHMGKTTPEQTQKLLDDELLRFGRTHGPFMTEAFSMRFGIGEGVAETALRRLEAQGVFLSGVFKKNAPESQWIYKDTLARLRKRSLSVARKAVKPIPFHRYLTQVFALQGVQPRTTLPQGTEALLEIAARFEGCYLPSALWEEVVFPARLKSYTATSLDLLLEAGDIVWQQQEDTTAFYPADSVFGPQPRDVFHGFDSEEDKILDESSEPIAQAIRAILSRKGPLLYDDLVSNLFLHGAYEQQEIVMALGALCAQGALGNDSYAFLRAQDTQGLTNIAQSSAVQKRPTQPVSRRGRLSLAGSRMAKAEARNAVLAKTRQAKALSGHWFMLEPSQASPEERVLAAIESVLDLYGVISPDTVKLSGVHVEWSALSPVLRTMEETGVLLRGCYVEELGPVQYAQKETIDTLQAFSSDAALAKKSCVEGSWVVLAVNDPAQCYGALADWPTPVNTLVQKRDLAIEKENSEGDVEKRPRIPRSKDWLTVFCDGVLVLATQASFKAIYVFSDDRDYIKHSVQRALEAIQQRAQQQGESLSRKKMVAKTINGKDIFDTGFAELLKECDFIPLPDGMRYYPQPF